MPLTAQQIIASTSDQELFAILSAELNQRLSHIRSDDELLLAMQKLPVGLRAIASIHRLDISLAMNDLGWHFYNFPHDGLCDETARGLHELEADEIALIFKQARNLIEPNREKILELKQLGNNAFSEWYVSSKLEAALNLLNKQLWNICARSPDYGILQFWLGYARKFPERVVG